MGVANKVYTVKGNENKTMGIYNFLKQHLYGEILNDITKR